MPRRSFDPSLAQVSDVAHTDILSAYDYGGYISKKGLRIEALLNPFATSGAFLTSEGTGNFSSDIGYYLGEGAFPVLHLNEIVYTYEFLRNRRVVVAKSKTNTICTRNYHCLCCTTFNLVFKTPYVRDKNARKHVPWRFVEEESNQLHTGCGPVYDIPGRLVGRNFPPLIEWVKSQVDSGNYPTPGPCQKYLETLGMSLAEDSDIEHCASKKKKGMSITCITNMLKDIVSRHRYGSLQKYQKIEYILSIYKASNPSATVALQKDSDNSFYRMFVSLPKAKEIFETLCTPVLFVDGAHSRTRMYQGTLVMFAAKDGFGKGVILAVAWVPRENGEHMSWAVQMFSTTGIDIQNCAIFTDRGNLLTVARVFHTCSVTLSLKFCLEHIIRNIKTAFKMSKYQVKYMATFLGYAVDAMTFEDFVRKLRYLIRALRPDTVLGYDISVYLLQIHPRHWTNFANNPVLYGVGCSWTMYEEFFIDILTERNAHLTVADRLNQNQIFWLASRFRNLPYPEGRPFPLYGVKRNNVAEGFSQKLLSSGIRKREPYDAFLLLLQLFKTQLKDMRKRYTDLINSGGVAQSRSFVIQDVSLAPIGVVLFEKARLESERVREVARVYQQETDDYMVMHVLTDVVPLEVKVYRDRVVCFGRECWDDGCICGHSFAALRECHRNNWTFDGTMSSTILQDCFPIGLRSHGPMVLGCLAPLVRCLDIESHDWQSSDLIPPPRYILESRSDGRTRIRSRGEGDNSNAESPNRSPRSRRTSARSGTVSRLFDSFVPSRVFLDTIGQLRDIGYFGVRGTQDDDQLDPRVLDQLREIRHRVSRAVTGPRRAYRCSHCGSDEHTIRRCIEYLSVDRSYRDPKDLVGGEYLVFAPIRRGIFHDVDRVDFLLPHFFDEIPEHIDTESASLTFHGRSVAISEEGYDPDESRGSQGNPTFEFVSSSILSQQINEELEDRDNATDMASIQMAQTWGSRRSAMTYDSPADVEGFETLPRRLSAVTESPTLEGLEEENRTNRTNLSVERSTGDGVLHPDLKLPAKGRSRTNDDSANEPLSPNRQSNNRLSLCSHKRSFPNRQVKGSKDGAKPPASLELLERKKVSKKNIPRSDQVAVRSNTTRPPLPRPRRTKHGSKQGKQVPCQKLSPPIKEAVLYQQMYQVSQLTQLSSPSPSQASKPSHSVDRSLDTGKTSALLRKYNPNGPRDFESVDSEDTKALLEAIHNPPCIKRSELRLSFTDDEEDDVDDEAPTHVGGMGTEVNTVHSIDSDESGIPEPPGFLKMQEKTPAVKKLELQTREMMKDTTTFTNTPNLSRDKASFMMNRIIEMTKPNSPENVGGIVRLNLEELVASVKRAQLEKLRRMGDATQGEVGIADTHLTQIIVENNVSYRTVDSWASRENHIRTVQGLGEDLVVEADKACPVEETSRDNVSQHTSPPRPVALRYDSKDAGRNTVASDSDGVVTRRQKALSLENEKKRYGTPIRQRRCVRRKGRYNTGEWETDSNVSHVTKYQKAKPGPGSNVVDIPNFEKTWRPPKYSDPDFDDYLKNLQDVSWNEITNLPIVRGGVVKVNKSSTQLRSELKKANPNRFPKIPWSFDSKDGHVGFTNTCSMDSVLAMVCFMIENAVIDVANIDEMRLDRITPLRHIVSLVRNGNSDAARRYLILQGLAEGAPYQDEWRNMIRHAELSGQDAKVNWWMSPGPYWSLLLPESTLSVEANGSFCNNMDCQRNLPNYGWNESKRFDVSIDNGAKSLQLDKEFPKNLPEKLSSSLTKLRVLKDHKSEDCRLCGQRKKRMKHYQRLGQLLIVSLSNQQRNDRQQVRDIPLDWETENGKRFVFCGAILNGGGHTTAVVFQDDTAYWYDGMRSTSRQWIAKPLQKFEHEGYYIAQIVYERVEGDNIQYVDGLRRTMEPTE